MARTKVTPKKEKRREKWVLQLREARKELAEKGRRPLPSAHPSPARKPSPTREEEKKLEEAERHVEEARWLRMWEGPHCHCQLDSWPRWLQSLGHLLWEGGSQEEALTYHGGKAPQKEFLQAGKVKKPRKYWPGTVALWRSGSSKRALSSLLGNSPSHG